MAPTSCWSMPRSPTITFGLWAIFVPQCCMSEVWTQRAMWIVGRVIGKAHGAGQFAHGRAGTKSITHGRDEVCVACHGLRINVTQRPTYRILAALDAETTNRFNLLAAWSDLTFRDVAEKRIFFARHLVEVHTDNLMLPGCYCS